MSGRCDGEVAAWSGTIDEAVDRTVSRATTSPRVLPAVTGWDLHLPTVRGPTEVRRRRAGSSSAPGREREIIVEGFSGEGGKPSRYVLPSVPLDSLEDAAGLVPVELLAQIRAEVFPGAVPETARCRELGRWLSRRTRLRPSSRHQQPTSAHARRQRAPRPATPGVTNGLSMNRFDQRNAFQTDEA